VADLLTGPTFALLCALTFGFGAIITRRAVIRDAAVMHGVLISILSTLPFIFIILLLSGQVGSIFSFSASGYVWLCSAGIIHFVIGRWMYFKSIQISGANIATILRRVDSLVALLLGAELLQETVTLPLVVGILLIVAGVAATSVNPKGGSGRKLRLSLSPRALCYGLGAGVLWGITPVMLRAGLQETHFPVAGTFVAFLAPAVVLGGLWLLVPGRRAAFSHLSGSIIGLYCIVGFLSGLANIFRFQALNLAPASVVTPLLSTTPIFLLTFSFLLNRKLEVFTLPVIIGTAAVVLGTLCLV